MVRRSSQGLPLSKVVPNSTAPPEVPLLANTCATCPRLQRPTKAEVPSWMRYPPGLESRAALGPADFLCAGVTRPPRPAAAFLWAATRQDGGGGRLFRKRIGSAEGSGAIRLWRKPRFYRGSGDKNVADLSHLGRPGSGTRRAPPAPLLVLSRVRRSREALTTTTTTATATPTLFLYLKWVMRLDHFHPSRMGIAQVTEL